MKKAKIILSLLNALIMAFILGSIIDGATGNHAAAAAFSLIIFAGAVILGLAYGQEKGMAYACGAIAAGIATNCANIPTPGIQTTVWLANLSDIASMTVDVTNKTLVTDITMVLTKKFYAFTGVKKIGKAGYKTTEGTYLNTLEHSAEIVILQNDPASKAVLDQMVNGNLVLIVENKTVGTAGNMKYEIYGREAGLTVAPEKDSDSADTRGGHLLKMKTPTGEAENHLPSTLFDTDEATTDALIVTITT